MNTPLKFLMDVGVSKAAEEWMRSESYDVLTVREIDPRMPDIDILSLAAAEQRILVTMDKDFGELVYHSGQAHAGVLLLRMEEATGAKKLPRFRLIFISSLWISSVIQEPDVNAALQRLTYVEK